MGAHISVAILQTLKNQTIEINKIFLYLTKILHKRDSVYSGRAVEYDDSIPVER